jgi:hypothetical protein
MGIKHSNNPFTFKAAFVVKKIAVKIISPFQGTFKFIFDLPMYVKKMHYKSDKGLLQENKHPAHFSICSFLIQAANIKVPTLRDFCPFGK